MAKFKGRAGRSVVQFLKVRRVNVFSVACPYASPFPVMSANRYLPSLKIHTILSGLPEVILLEYNERFYDSILFRVHHVKGFLNFIKAKGVTGKRTGIDPVIFDEPQEALHPYPTARA